jgi:hypothetical protein
VTASRRLALSAAIVCALVTPSAAGAKIVTIQVLSIGAAKVHDRPPKGTSKGDTVVYRDRLVNAKAQFGKKKGVRVGSDRGTMTFTSAHAARFSGSATLPGGTLTLQGRVTALPDNALAIPVTGGTGDFAGAKGYLIVGSGHKQALNVYRLTISSSHVA